MNGGTTYADAADGRLIRDDDALVREIEDIGNRVAECFRANVCLGDETRDWMIASDLTEAEEALKRAAKRIRAGKPDEQGAGFDYDEREVAV